MIRIPPLGGPPCGWAGVWVWSHVTITGIVHERNGAFVGGHHSRLKTTGRPAGGFAEEEKQKLVSGRSLGAGGPSVFGRWVWRLKRAFKPASVMGVGGRADPGCPGRGSGFAPVRIRKEAGCAGRCVARFDSRDDRRDRIRHGRARDAGITGAGGTARRARCGGGCGWLGRRSLGDIV